MVWELLLLWSFLFSDFSLIRNTPHDGTSSLILIPSNVIRSFIPSKDQAKEGRGGNNCIGGRRKQMIAKLVSIQPLPKVEITLCRMQFQISTPLRRSNQELFVPLAPLKKLGELEETEDQNRE